MVSSLGLTFEAYFQEGSYYPDYTVSGKNQLHFYRCSTLESLGESPPFIETSDNDLEPSFPINEDGAGCRKSFCFNSCVEL